MSNKLYGAVLLGAIVVTACSPAEEQGMVQQAACNCDIDPQPCCCTTPVLLDIAGDGIRLGCSSFWTTSIMAPR